MIVSADAGAMGGSKSEEFMHPTPVGEDTIVRSASGYAANVEAVEVPVVVATHDLDLAASCDRVLVVDGGRVVADDAPGPALAAYRALLDDA